MKNHPQHTNALIYENSPYLLQHAHNPVNWYAWNDDNLNRAKSENKLLLISVGYSACHWCHVMEHESFENTEVAKLMNEHFINLKVDREERPDVDLVYMNAIQIMTGAGGWPMNIVALPDGRPVWGGTYFPKERWMSALTQLAHLYDTQPEKMEEYAIKLEEGLQKLQIIELPENPPAFTREFYKKIFQKWKKQFDFTHGGFNGAPKFMMPNNFQFLLRYAFQENNKNLMDFVQLSLNKMAYGGIFDPIGGGFSRYAVDQKWHIPHFEKMLYDNAQLVSLYSQAYKVNPEPLYKKVVYKTLNFIQQELMAPDFAFYSALDADSKNTQGILEEGAFYTFTAEELKTQLQDNFEVFAEFYNINSFGKWENNRYVFIRTKTLEAIAGKFNISIKTLEEKISNAEEKLKEYRNKRDKPALDDKSLTSWNALMLTGFLEAYTAFDEDRFLNIALKNADFLIKNLIKEDGSLQHTYKNGESKLNGYLEDYAFCIEAFIKLYEITFEEKYLQLAKNLSDITLKDFSGQSPLLYFNSKHDRQLVTRNIESTDNVIPASNSVMTKNLFKLSKLLSKKSYEERAELMLKAIQAQMESYPRGYTNWLDVMLNFTHPFYEIATTGKKAVEISKKMQKNYIPNTVVAGTSVKSDMPLLINRLKEKNNLIYVCSKGKCELPVKSVEESLQIIKHV